MRRRCLFYSILALVVIVVLPRAVLARAWGGSGGVTALVIDPQIPTTLYAVTSDGSALKSTDGGATWNAIGPTSISVTALAVDPLTQGTLYAGTSDRGVLKSTDGGKNWSGTGLINNGVTGLGIDPQTPATLYALVDGTGVLKSTDGGATWSATSLMVGQYNSFMMTIQFMQGLAIDPLTPGTLYAGAYFLSSEMGWAAIFKSTDGGASWSDTGAVLNWVQALAIDPVTPTTIYAVDPYATVYKSTDGGATWSGTSLTNISVTVLVIDPVTPDSLYAGTSDRGVFKSTDGGATWSVVNAGLTDILATYGVGSDVGSLVIEPLTSTTDPNHVLSLYAGTEIGVFKSTDRGASWSPTGLFQHSLLSSVSFNPATVTGGATSTGTVTLITAAPAGNVTVTLSSNNTTLAIAPATVTVSPGARNATFAVSTNPVTVSTSVTISAASDDATRSAVLNVNVPTILDSLSLYPTGVLGGTPSTGYVHLTTAAPTGGAVVPLSSSNPSVAMVPVSVTVAAGAWNANFPISTGAVSSPTAVTISGTYGGASSAALLTVTPATALSSLRLNPISVVGGNSSIGTVTLSAAAPAGGTGVALSSGNLAVATVPASVTVPAGATWVNFTVSTSSVAASTLVTIWAANYSAVLTVNPPPTLSSVSLNPASVTGGTPSTGTVTLTTPVPTGGATVALSSSKTAIATVPASVTLTAGAASANFTVSTTACASGAVTISGTYGAITRSAGLTVSSGPIDTLIVQQADYFASRRELRIAAKGSNSTATLRVYVTSTGELTGQLMKGGDGTYRAQFTWPTNPQNITVQSSLCGRATKDVTSK